MQWLMPSRIMLAVYVILCTIAFTYLDWTLSLKWYILDAILLLAFLMAMPDGEISRRFWKSFWSIPGALLKSVFSGGKKEKQ